MFESSLIHVLSSTKVSPRQHFYFLRTADEPCRENRLLIIKIYLSTHVKWILNAINNGFSWTHNLAKNVIFFYQLQFSFKIAFFITIKHKGLNCQNQIFQSLAECTKRHCVGWSNNDWLAAMAADVEKL